MNQVRNSSHKKKKVLEESSIDSDDSAPKKKAKAEKGGDIYKAPKTTAVSYTDDKQAKKHA